MKGHLIIARQWDVLALPGVSIGVMSVFSSSCRHTLNDSPSSFTAISADLTIIIKEWMKRGGNNMVYVIGSP